MSLGVWVIYHGIYYTMDSSSFSWNTAVFSVLVTLYVSSPDKYISRIICQAPWMIKELAAGNLHLDIRKSASQFSFWSLGTCCRGSLQRPELNCNGASLEEPQLLVILESTKWGLISKTLDSGNTTCLPLLLQSQK